MDVTVVLNAGHTPMGLVVLAQGSGPRGSAPPRVWHNNQQCQVEGQQWLLHTWRSSGETLGPGTQQQHQQATQIIR